MSGALIADLVLLAINGVWWYFIGKEKGEKDATERLQEQHRKDQAFVVSQFFAMKERNAWLEGRIGEAESINAHLRESITASERAT